MVRDSVAVFAPSNDPYMYEPYDLLVEARIVYYSGSNLVMNAYVVNTHVYDVDAFSYIQISVYDKNDNRIATKTFNNIGLYMRPDTIVSKTFTFENAKKTDIAEDLYYYYTFEYIY